MTSLKCQGILVNLLLVVVICSCGAQQVTIITQPDNTTVCEGETAVFTCVMDILFVNVNTKNIKWWRRIKDHNNNVLLNPVMVTQIAHRFNINNSVSEHRLTSVLTITNVMLQHGGPYWLEIIDAREACNVAFLKILPDVPLNIGFPMKNITDVSFIVQWDTVTNQSVDRYVVNWTNGTNPIQTVTVSETSYTITGLSPNTTYTVNVAAVNKCGTGPFTTNKTVTTNISFSVDTASTATVFFSINPTANTITTITITSTTTTTAVNSTNPVDTTSVDGSGGNSGRAIAGGVIGAILAIVVIAIIVIVLFKLYLNKIKDTEGSKRSFYNAILSGRSSKHKNTLAVSNSLMYNEAYKTEAKAVPHQTTDTGELYAVSTKVVDKDTHSEPPLLYAYAIVDTQRNIADISVPPQAAADDVQHVLSAKEATIDDHVTNNDVNQAKDQEIKYAELQSLPTPTDLYTIRKEDSIQYVQFTT